jgi:ribonuclease PH
MVPRSPSKRSENRRSDQLRKVSLQTGISRYAEGSCFIKMGHTHVMCLASVEDDLPEWRAEKGLGWVTAEYAMIPRATHTRSRRESVKGKISGRTSEISRLIGRSLRAVVDFAKLGPRTITIDCEVLQADGGTRCAAITGGYVALEAACRHLKKEGLIREWPLQDSVAAVSVGIVGRDLLLDLSYEEDSQAEVDMNLVMTGGGKIIEVQGTAEGQPFSLAEADHMMRLAATGAAQLCNLQEKAVKES